MRLAGSKRGLHSAGAPYDIGSWLDALVLGMTQETKMGFEIGVHITTAPQQTRELRVVYQLLTCWLQESAPYLVGEREEGSEAVLSQIMLCACILWSACPLLYLATPKVALCTRSVSYHECVGQV